jgi:hypothetical protein
MTVCRSPSISWPGPGPGGLRGNVFGPYWLVLPVQREPAEVVAKFVDLDQPAVYQFGVEASAHVTVMVEEAALQRGHFSSYGRPLGERQSTGNTIRLFSDLASGLVTFFVRVEGECRPAGIR